MKYKSLTLTYILFFLCFILPVEYVSAKSITYSVSYLENDGCIPGNDCLTVTIIYTSQVTNQDGGVLNDGNSVRVGDVITFTKDDFSHNTQTSFFNRKGAPGSPYGQWREGATFDNSLIDCIVGGGPDGEDLCTGQFEQYSVDPPIITITHGGTAGLSCNGSKTTCTVTSAGSILSSFVMASTLSAYYPESRGNPYSITIPQQTISYNLVATEGAAIRVWFGYVDTIIYSLLKVFSNNVFAGSLQLND